MADEIKNLRQAIVDRLEANFSAAPIAWPGVTLQASGETHVVKAMIPIDGQRQAALGSSSNRIDGHLILAVGMRADAANRQSSIVLEGYIDDLMAIFPRAQTVTVGSKSARFQTPIPDSEDYSEEGWMFRLLRCPFYLYT